MNETIYYTVPDATGSTGTYVSVKGMTDSGDYTLGDDAGAKSGDTYYYVVDQDVDLEKGLSLTVVNNANVVLILVDGKSLTINEAGDGKAGINVTDTQTVEGVWDESRSLTITSGNTSETIQGTGELYAKGGTGAAGIGGNTSEAGRNIEINGGTVKAFGGVGAAGIGGGWDVNGADCSGGNITINGGTVKASGGAKTQYAGAGIGGGDMSNADNITITGGTVEATGGTCGFDVGAAGIGGGGYGGSAEGITITGGTVKASGGGSGADAIGAGAGDGAAEGTSSDVKVDESLTVKAGAKVTDDIDWQIVDPDVIEHDIKSDLSEVTDFHQQYVTIATDKTSLAGAVVKVNGTYTFSGQQIAPTDVTVTLNGVTLKAGTDYTISYGENNNAGAKAGSLTITGKDAYEGKVSATFEILQKSVSVTGSAADSKAYDGTTEATVSGSTLEGKIDSTDVSLVATGNFSDKNAGTEKAVLVSYALTGDDAANYKLTSASESLTANISQKQLTVSGTAPVFDYDGSASAAVTAGSLAGVVSGDAVQIASATATTTDGQMAPGSHDMTVNYTLSGDDAGNYTLASETMAGFIRIVVKGGDTSEKLEAGTYGNDVEGYAGTTGAVGETLPETDDNDAGVIDFLDGVTFSGSNANAKGAFYNTGTVNLLGTVTQNGENDGIYNEGTLNWDLTDTTKGQLVGYQYLTNAESGELTISLNANDAAGSSYVIATGNFSSTTGKNTFYLTGVSSEDDVSITIGGSTVEYNDKTYRLYVDDNGTKENLDDDKLTLKSVTSNPDVTIDTEEKWFKSGETITISGTAQSYSTGGLDKMEVTVGGVTVGITFEETIPGSKNYTWSYTYTGADTDGTTLTVTATDKAGSETTPGTATYNLKVDTKAPDAVLTTTEGYEKDGVTWYKQHAEATLSAKVTDATTDATLGSGLDKVTLDGSAYASETAVTLDTSSERTSAVTKTLVATDVAGNETTKTFAYDVDGTGPVLANSAISGSATYKVSDNSYWVKQGATDVTVTTTVSDAKSGVKDGSIKLDGKAYEGGASVKIDVITSTEVTLDEGSHTISAEDNVGNAGSKSVKVGVDGTGPEISDPTVTSAHKYETTDGTWVKQSDGATVKATITDAKSGLAGAAFNGAIYESGSDAAIDTSVESGLTDQTFTATDHVTNESSKSVKVGVDGSGPEIADPTVAGGNAYKAEEGKYWVKLGEAATVAATITDAKSGVDASSVKFDGADYTSGEGATLDTATEVELTDHTFAASDNVTNASTKTIQIGVDGTEPTFAEIDLESANKYVTRSGVWVKKGDATTASTTITDAKSGVNADKVTFDGDAYISGAAATVDTSAESEIRDYAFGAEDNVGNASSKSVKVGVDGTGPDFDITFKSWNKYAVAGETDTYWVQRDSVATATAVVSDAKSGVDASTVTYDGGIYVSGTVVTINTASESDFENYTFAASDNVSNASSKSLRIGVDGTGPKFSLLALTSEHLYRDGDDVWVLKGDATALAASVTDDKSGVNAETVKFDGEDYVSGESIDLDVSVETEMREHTFSAEDNVANKSTETVRIGVDGTGPHFSEIDLRSAHAYEADDGYWVRMGDATSVKTIVTDEKSGVNAATLTFNGAAYVSGALAKVDTAAESDITDYTFAGSDNVTNASTSSIRIGVDGTGPDIAASEISSAHKYVVEEGVWVKKDDYTTVSTTVTDAKSGVAAIVFDGSVYTSGDAAWVDTSAESVIRDYVIRATDNVANVSSEIVKIGVDGTGPTLVSIVSNPESWTTGSVTLTVTYDDGLGSGVKTLEYSEDSETWSVLTGGTYTADENKTVYFRATDNVGNVSEVTSYDIGKIDPTSPSISAFTSAIDLTVGAATVVMTAENEISNVAEYRINGGDWQVYAGPVEHWVDLRAGTADTVFEVKNGAGTVSSYTYTAGSEQELYVNRTYKFYAGEKISYGFLKMMGGDKSDTITFGANSSVHLTGGAVDLSTGSNAIKVERNADVDFICESIDNVATLNVAAGVTVTDKKVDTATKRITSVTYQGVTYADFSSIAFSADWNASLTVGAYAAVSTGDLSANVKKSNKISVGRNASFSAGDISDFYSISVTAGAKHSYDSYATDASTGDRLFTKGEQGYTTFSAGVVTMTAKNDTLSFGNFTDIDLESVATGLGNDKISLGSDATLDAKELDFGGGTDTLSIGNSAKSTIDGVLSFGEGNDTLRIGSDSTFAAKALDFGAVDAAKSTDRFTVGSRSVAAIGTYEGDVDPTFVGGAISGVQTISLSAGKAATKTAEEVDTKLSAGAVTMLSAKADTVSIGNYAEVKIASLTTGTGADRVAVGSYDAVDLGDVLLGEGNDTLSIGSYSEVTAKSLDFGDGKSDRLSVGTGSTLTVTDLDVDSIGTLTLTSTKGKEARLYLGADSFAAAEERANTDKTWKKYIDNGQIAEIG